ncbi:conserved hypothetical protein [Ricinus communis]|uniref:Uncharacterized protein n=1 Tax=Ricinus communis TaxID=3988 RepID=B9SKS9_RICCO|nr:conserved hypothetical protein [Ricinus communis]
MEVEGTREIHKNCCFNLCSTSGGLSDYMKAISSSEARKEHPHMNSLIFETYFKSAHIGIAIVDEHKWVWLLDRCCAMATTRRVDDFCMMARARLRETTMRRR